MITGAAGGIGRALAHRFVAAGADVALLDVDEAGLARVRDELPGGRSLTVRCDVTDQADCERAIGEVVAQRGGVDVLVNNAGISHRSAFRETDPSVLRKVMDVNFFGAVYCTHAAIESVTARRGTVVAISSVAGYAPLVERTGYAASKHALHGLFDTLRAELNGTGVNVLLVCPSYTDTAIDRNALDGSGVVMDQPRAVLGRMATPQEVADQVLRAVAQRRHQILISPVAKASWWVSHVAPRAYSWLMRRSQR